MVDPLEAFISRSISSSGQRPIPLKSTRFDVWIKGGLATVETLRLFRNDESQSIEATITFPLPIHATLFDLRVRSGGRDLIGRALRRTEARDNYEQALERGKTAVLHEELLRGIHMLSIGHIPAGAEVEVRTRWAITLTNVNRKATLRIPTTAGDVYGSPHLPDSDRLIHGGEPQTADLSVHSDSGQVALLGRPLDNGRATVSLDAPIDLEVVGWASSELVGRDARGRTVRLNVQPNATGEAPLDIALVIDHSGSMAEALAATDSPITKHDAIVTGLRKLGARLRQGDKVAIWQFNDSVSHVATMEYAGCGGQANDATLLRAWDRLLPPSGGTEIGQALAHVTAHSDQRDILLVTDGKSYEIDVQALAQSGRRFSAILVGEDSLEANVGHLAAITGGNLFILSSDNAADTLDAAIRQLRDPVTSRQTLRLPLTRISNCRGGMKITAERGTEASRPPSDLFDRSVAAVGASLAIPLLEADSASQLALDEGLVTYLTSLILVDEESTPQIGVPATRKIALPTPRTHLRAMAPRTETMEAMRLRFSNERQVLEERQVMHSLECPPSVAPKGISRPVSFADLGARIDWDREPGRLQIGDISGLEPRVAERLYLAAEVPEIVKYAERIGIDALVLVIALLARSQSQRNRSAQRIANAILRNESPDELEQLMGILNAQI